MRSLGLTIHRFTLRRYAGDLVDAADRAERERTRVVLAVGASGLATAVLAEAATRRPFAFGRASAMAVKAGRSASRVWSGT